MLAYQKIKIKQCPTCKPCSQAFFATRAAPSMTLGFDVLVQLVIAAITTLPCLSSARCPWNENFATFPCASLGMAKPCIKRKKGRAEVKYGSFRKRVHDVPKGNKYKTVETTDNSDSEQS